MSAAKSRQLADGTMVAGLVPGESSPYHFSLTARTRAGKIAQLRRHLARWGERVDPAWRVRLQQLLLGRGRFSRQARRARVHGIGKTMRAIRAGRGRDADRAAPRRSGGERIPRADRVLLLRQEGRPVSGRQWRQFRKAARRQAGDA